eukprot:m.55168 g.55168  ORF g.55168 m.55168 type:complete len:1269 (+) comp12930_c1_seq1:267-4073(+)
MEMAETEDAHQTTAATVRFPPIAQHARQRPVGDEDFASEFPTYSFPHIRDDASLHGLSALSSRLQGSTSSLPMDQRPLGRNLGRIVSEAIDDVLYYQQELDDKNVRLLRLQRSLDQLRQKEHLFSRAMEASARKEAMCDDLQVTVNQLQQQLKAAEETTATLKAERDHFANIYSTAVSDARTAAQKVEQLQAELSTTTQQFDSTRGELQTSHQSAEALTRKLEELERRHQAEMQQVQQAGDTTKAHLEQQLAEQQVQLEAQLSTSNEQRQHIIDLEQRLAQMAAEKNEQAETSASTLQRHDDALKLANDQLDQERRQHALFLTQLSGPLSCQPEASEIMGAMRNVVNKMQTIECDLAQTKATQASLSAAQATSTRDLRSLHSMLASIFSSTDSKDKAPVLTSAASITSVVAPVIGHLRALRSATTTPTTESGDTETPQAPWMEWVCACLETSITGTCDLVQALTASHVQEQTGLVSRHRTELEQLQRQVDDEKHKSSQLLAEQQATKEQLHHLRQSLSNTAVTFSALQDEGPTTANLTRGSELSSPDNDTNFVRTIIEEIQQKHSHDLDKLKLQLSNAEQSLNTMKQEQTMAAQSWRQEQEELHATYKKRLADADQRVHRLEFQLQTTAAETSSHQQRCHALQELIDQLKHDAASSDEHMRRLERENTEHAHKIESQTAMLQSLQDEVSLRKATIQDLQGKVLQLRKQLDETQNSFEEEKNKMVSAIVHLKQRKQENEQRLQSQQALLDQRGVLANMTQSQRRILELEADLASARARLSDVKASLNADLLQEVQQLKKQLREAQQTITATEIERDSARQNGIIELSLLKSKVTTLEKELESVRAEYEAIKKEDFESVIRSYQQQVKEFEGIIELKENEVNEQKKLLELANDRIKFLEEDPQRDEREKQLEEKIAALKGVISQLKSAAEEDAAALRTLRADHMERDAAVQQHERRIRELEHENSVMVADRQDLLDGVCTWANQICQAGLPNDYEKLDASVWTDEHEDTASKKQKWQRRLDRIATALSNAFTQRDEQLAKMPTMIKAAEDRIRLQLTRQQDKHSKDLAAMSKKMERQQQLLADYDAAVARIKELELRISQLDAQLALRLKEKTELQTELTSARDAERAAVDEIEQLKSTNKALEERSKHSVAERLLLQQQQVDEARVATAQRIKELEVQLEATKVDWMKRLRSKNLLIASLKRELEALRGRKSSMPSDADADAEAVDGVSHPNNSTEMSTHASTRTSLVPPSTRGSQILTDIHNALQSSP